MFQVFAGFGMGAVKGIPRAVVPTAKRDSIGAQRAAVGALYKPVGVLLEQPGVLFRDEGGNPDGRLQARSLICLNSPCTSPPNALPVSNQSPRYEEYPSSIWTYRSSGQRFVM